MRCWWGMRHVRWQGCGPAYVKLGRAVRYTPSDLEAWITAHRHQPVALEELQPAHGDPARRDVGTPPGGGAWSLERRFRPQLLTREETR